MKSHYKIENFMRSKITSGQTYIIRMQKNQPSYKSHKYQSELTYQVNSVTENCLNFIVCFMRGKIQRHIPNIAFSVQRAPDSILNNQIILQALIKRKKKYISSLSCGRNIWPPLLNYLLFVVHFDSRRCPWSSAQLL